MTQAERSELMAIIRELSYEEREVTLASGRKSNFYFDGKQTCLERRHGRGSGVRVGGMVRGRVGRGPSARATSERERQRNAKHRSCGDGLKGVYDVHW